MNRYKPVGWRKDSYRHYLAAKGVKTKYYGVKGRLAAMQLREIADTGTSGFTNERKEFDRQNVREGLIIPGADPRFAVATSGTELGKMAVGNTELPEQLKEEGYVEIGKSEDARKLGEAQSMRGVGEQKRDVIRALKARAMSDDFNRNRAAVLGGVAEFRISEGGRLMNMAGDLLDDKRTKDLIEKGHMTVIGKGTPEFEEGARRLAGKHMFEVGEDWMEKGLEDKARSYRLLSPRERSEEMMRLREEGLSPVVMHKLGFKGISDEYPDAYEELVIKDITPVIFPGEFDKMLAMRRSGKYPSKIERDPEVTEEFNKLAKEFKRLKDKGTR